MVNRRAFLQASGALSVGSISGISGCLGNGELPTINQSYTVPATNIGSLLDIPDLQEELPNVGTEYELNMSHVPATPQVITTMASGENDIGILALLSFQQAIEADALPEGMMAVSIDFYDATEDYYNNGVYALEESGIDEPSDLEGATIAINALGGAYEALVSRKLLDVGLEPGVDTSWIEIEFPAIESALREGRADAGTLPGIFHYIAQMEGGIHTVFENRELWGRRFPFVFNAVRTEFAEESPDLVEAWCEDYVTCVQYAYDNRDEVIPLIADYFELSEEILDGFYLTEQDVYRPRDGYVDIEALQFVTDELEEMGYLDESLDIGDHATNEFLPDY